VAACVGALRTDMGCSLREQCSVTHIDLTPFDMGTRIYVKE